MLHANRACGSTWRKAKSDWRKKTETFIGKILGNLKISFVNVLHFLKLLLYFLVICVIFCHFGKWKKIFKNDYHVAAQIQGTSAEKSWKAGWRRSGQGSLLRELWWACLDEELPSGLECRADSKTVGGPDPGWNGTRGGSSGARSPKTPKMQLY